MISTQIVAEPGTSLSKLPIQASFNEIPVFDALTHKVVAANRAARSNLQYALKALRKLGMQDIPIQEWQRSTPGLSLLSQMQRRRQAPVSLG